jgi:ABC-type multidrug transport system fused ATPase/permease subunit
MLELYKTFVEQNASTLLVYVAIVCMLSLERVAIPHVYGKLLDSLRQAKFNLTSLLFGTVVGIFVLFQVFDTALTYMDAHIMPKFEAFVRRHVVDVIMDRHAEHYAELDLGNITSKLIKLPANLNSLFYNAKTFLFNHVLSTIFTVGYLYYCHWSLGAIFTVAFGILALLTWNFCARCRAPSYVRDLTFDNMQESVHDILYNLQSVHSSRTMEYEKQNVDKLNNDTVSKVQEWVFCGIPYRLVFAVLFLAVFAGVTGMGIRLYRQHQMTLALLVSSFMVTFSILRTCIHFYYDFENYIYVSGSIQVVSDYIDSLPDKIDEHVSSSLDLDELSVAARTSAEAQVLASGPVDISLKHVSFANPSGSSVFENVSLMVPANTRLAIVGGIGSGKSTLAHMITRFRSPTSGTIYMNGVPIEDIPLDHIRKAVYYVPQQPRLFNRTLWENICYGRDSETIAEARPTTGGDGGSGGGSGGVHPDHVYKMLERLDMRELAQVFREKMHQSVGKQGSHLSGGQRQITLLLRAILNHDARVLILDEPTSALDAVSRDQVIKLILSVAKNRTLIVITHDRELATQMDQIHDMGR